MSVTMMAATLGGTPELPPIATVVVVDDAAAETGPVATSLRDGGYAVEVVHTPDALTRPEQDTSGVALVLLDVGPRNPGAGQVLARWRSASPATPVVVLGPRSDPGLVQAFLGRGAVGQVLTPVDPPELLERVRSSLRATVLRWRDLELDLLTRRVHVAGRSVSMSAREFCLLETFLRHPGRVLGRAELLRTVWGFETGPVSNVVDVYVGYVRRKIGAGRLVTVPRSGYLLA